MKINDNLTVSGNVGIGTTSPLQKLHVASHAVFGTSYGNPGNIFQIEVPDTITTTLRFDAQNLRIWNPNIGEIIRFTNTGNIGIGTTSPAEKLHVIGNVRIDDAYKLLWSDVNLYRGAADVLKTDDNFDALALRIGGTEVINASQKIVNLGIDQSTIIYNASGDNRHIIWYVPTDPFRAIDLWNFRAIGGENTYQMVFYSSSSGGGFTSRLRIGGGADIVDVNIENAYLNIANQGLKIGGTEVITSGRVLQNVSASVAILTDLPLHVAGDDTEISTTSTSYPSSDQKYFNLNLFAGAYSFSRLLASIEGKATSGYQLTVGIYVDGSLKTEISWTETSYKLKTATISLSGLDSTIIHQVGIRLKVTGGTGYVRTVDFCLVK